MITDTQQATADRTLPRTRWNWCLLPLATALAALVCLGLAAADAQAAPVSPTAVAPASLSNTAPASLSKISPATLSSPVQAAPLPPTQAAPANGLRINPGSKAQPTATPPPAGATASAQPTASAEEVVRFLTGAEPLQGPRDIIRTGYWQANAYWLAPVTGAVLIAAAAIGYGLYRHSRRPVVLSPQLLALQAIDSAETQTEDKLFASTVSDAVRSYLEARFGLRAPEQTTDEFLQEARRSNLLPTDAVRSLAHLLELCDLAKFARQGLGAEQRAELGQAARNLVNALGTDPQTASANPPSPRS